MIVKDSTHGLHSLLSKTDRCSTGLQLIETNLPDEYSSNDNTQKYDPHIWLDPILVKYITRTISNQLIKLDPINSGYCSVAQLI